MYDIIGDIHGHADELTELLKRLGYDRSLGDFSHPSRKAIFVGDFIDGGPKIYDVLKIVRPMVEAGSAMAVMGNHEFNALAYHTPSPSQPDQFLRPHTDKNIHQHAKTVRQVPSAELESYLNWFRTLPMWLELDCIRVVHACWDSDLISVLDDAIRKHKTVAADFLAEATTPGTKLFGAVEAVLKGKELHLPNGLTFQDKYGHARKQVRVRWFESPADQTFRDYALASGGEFPNVAIPESAIESAKPYAESEPPVFFGHYWLLSDEPTTLASNVACVDYSVAKNGYLCAYRWDGERQLDDSKFETVQSR